MLRSIGNEAYIDDNGQLYITVPGVIDPVFGIPGMEVPPVITATGFTFDSVVTYGWPMSIFWNHHPLQFASAATATKIETAMKGLDRDLTIGQSLDEVKVGPFSRAAIRQITVSDSLGLIVAMNAGEMANQLARYPQGWRAGMLSVISIARNSRNREV